MQTYGGVSVVNAIPSWYGSSMAVDLKVEVTVEEGKGEEEQSPLIRTILEYFSQKYGVPPLRVKVNSQIPQMSGLKSSSAVSTALIGEISRKYGIEVDVPKLSAILSIKAGVSVTGALDDAAAAYYGGVSFTYNKEFKVIKMQNPPRDIVILLLPRGNRQGVNLSSLKRFSALFQEIFRIALHDVILAMKLNGVAVAEILGYDKEPILDAMRAGALAYGVSGNGPSIFAVAKEGEEGPVYERLSKYGKVVITRAVELEGRD